VVALPGPPVQNIAPKRPVLRSRSTRKRTAKSAAVGSAICAMVDATERAIAVSSVGWLGSRGCSGEPGIDDT
jgi:hypothetical protein